MICYPKMCAYPGRREPRMMEARVDDAPVGEAAAGAALYGLGGAPAPGVGMIGVPTSQCSTSLAFFTRNMLKI